MCVIGGLVELGYHDDAWMMALSRLESFQLPKRSSWALSPVEFLRAQTCHDADAVNVSLGEAGLGTR